MRTTFGRELLHQFVVALIATATFPALLTLAATGGAWTNASYGFHLAMSAPVFLTGGVLASVAIEQAKSRLLQGVGTGAAYAASLLLYALAGSVLTYVYLATLLRNLQIHASPDVYGLLAIGAGAALYVYHVSLALKRARK